MPFEPGTRLGPYEIIAPLGAGGMGEIYRARDTRLDRTVAIKVLTDALAADSESRRRFEQEARAIAALNDPHICTIHDVGRHRDLKPGNVMLVHRGGPSTSPDVKLLDFGLAARTTVARPQAIDASLVATLAPSQVATRPSTATTASGFGTVQYMAPEQLDGDA